MGLLKVLFLLLLLLFPFAEVGRVEFGNGVAFTINDIAVFFLVFGWVLIALINRDLLQRLSKSLLKPLAFFLFVCLLSLVFNLNNLSQHELFVAFLYLVRFTLYGGIYFVVVGFEKEFKQKIPLFMAISGISILGIGYIQYLLYPSLRNLYYLGWDEHLYRMFSSFLDPNFAGIFFALLFFFLTYMTVKNLKDKKRKKTLFFLVLLTSTTVGIFLTYSRSALLMFLSGTFTFLLFVKKKMWIFLFLLGLCALLIVSPRAFQTEGTNIFRKASGESRIESMQKAVFIFSRNPILGVGFNAYRYAQYRYGFLKEVNEQISHAGAGTDNSFLFILATTGIVGFVSFFFLWKQIIISAYHNLKDAKSTELQKTISLVLISSTVGLFVASFFINSLFYPFNLEWMWILVGLMEKT